MIQKPLDTRKVLLIDMDNTINKFWIGYQNAYNDLFRPGDLFYDGLKIEKEDLIEYDILINFFPEREQSERDKIRQMIFEKKNFWLDLPLYDDADVIIKELYKKYNTYIITSPWTSAKNCYIEKIEWITKHLPFFELEKVIFTRDKWLVNCDYIIDDAPFYLEREDCETIAIDYAYNRHIFVNYRTENWNEIANYLGV